MPEGSPVCVDTTSPLREVHPQPQLEVPLRPADPRPSTPLTCPGCSPAWGPRPWGGSHFQPQPPKCGCPCLPERPGAGGSQRRGGSRGTPVSSGAPEAQAGGQQLPEADGAPRPFGRMRCMVGSLLGKRPPPTLQEKQTFTKRNKKCGQRAVVRAQSVEHLTRDFSSGHDLAVLWVRAPHQAAG